MPNWCKNTLTISDNVEEVAAFIADNTGGWQKNYQGETAFVPLDFEKLFPKPDTFVDYEEEEKWLEENWGTTTNSTYPEQWQELSDGEELGVQHFWHIHERIASIVFWTAWSPPAAWLATVATKYPNLYMSIQFLEEGMLLKGIVEGQDDDVTTEAWEWLGDEYEEEE